ncbi:hypothetical protein Lal_00002748, partial [Lupinus albus]
MGSAPAQQKMSYNDHVQTRLCLHSVAASAAIRLVNAAWNVPVVAVPRLPNFQFETSVKCMFHHCLLYAM